MEELYTAEQMLYYLQTPFQTISKAVSDEASQKESEILLSFITSQMNEEEVQKRTETFVTLREIVKQWISETNQKFNEGKEEGKAISIGGDLYAFGSFKLKVALNDSDIDTICIVPRKYKREENFNGDLYEKLKGSKGVTELYKITEAFIPLIRLKLNGISVDILFSALNYDSVPKEINFKDDLLLLNLEEKCYRSLNGIRCAVILEGIVPHKENFRDTLLCLKLWAKQKGIYSSLMGYLSGISLAIMVAKICQLYPNYNVAKLMERFFFIYSVWRWDHMCVKVCNQRTEFEDPKLVLEQFNETSEKSFMNIITPAFPSINASHLISSTTFRIITSNLKEGHLLINAVRKKKRTWDHFFKPFNFFGKFHHLLEINIYSSDENEFVVWRGSVESKLRKLTKILDSFSESNHLEFHPSPVSFKNVYNEYHHCVTYYYGIKLKEFANETPVKVDFRPSVIYFIEILGAPPSESSKVVIKCTNRYTLPSSVFSSKEINCFSKNENSFLEFGEELEEFEKKKEMGKENFNRNSI